MRTAVVIAVAVKRPEAFCFTDDFVELLFLFFIFRNLIYLSPSFTGVGFGTGFPIFSPELVSGPRLPVGCQRINEPILSPLLDRSITHRGG